MAPRGRTHDLVSSAEEGWSGAPAVSRRLAVALAGLVLALVALTALVGTGKLNRLDQFGLDHLMPGLDPGAPASTGSAGLYRPFSLDTNWWSKILDLWTYPCSVLISALMLIFVSAYEWRRGRKVVAFMLAGAWVVGNGIEVIGKGVIIRPALFGTTDGLRLHVTSFDASFPSGHMMRGVLVAAAIVLIWKSGAKWVAVWALLVGPALVLQSAHTPTDVIGGGLVGLILIVLGVALIGEWERRANVARAPGAAPTEPR